jgi:adenylate cyclase
MNIFDSYTTRVKSALQQDRLNKSMSESYSNFTGPDTLLKAKSAGAVAARMSMQPENSLLTLDQVITRPDTADAQIGLHPDFRHLKGTDNREYHYITSAFIDIKGSTSLNDSYNLETIYNITNTVQSAAIHVCLLFRGHIQRLQGDGVFVYFGGKNITKGEAVKNAVTATAMFTYFVQNDLQRIFEEEGVENICTRTGIDFGDDRDVLWANFGVGNCTELTTLSLHTSLAPKMQSYAGKNGIIVGQHVKDRLIIDEKFFDLVRDSKGEIIKRYIYEGRKRNFYYTQYQFKWLNYLKSLPYIKADADGNLYVVSQQQQEKDRLAKLQATALLITSGNAYTDNKGNIIASPTSVKNQPHRFHYE